MKDGLYVSCVKCHPNLTGAIKNINENRHKIYLRKDKEIFGFSVWEVNGSWIRTNICEDFVNWGQHYWFKFIPKNEFWVDKGYAGKEEGFFIHHLLIENRLMAEGKKGHLTSEGRIRNYAFNKALASEKRERNKSSFVRRFLKKLKGHRYRKKIIEKVHKHLLKEYSSKINVWIVRGEVVRDFFDVNFGGGGHGIVDPFTPKNEIWIDDDISQKERKFILLHEMHERRRMANEGLSYLKAHKSATRIEDFYRHHPKNIDKALKEESESQPVR